MRSSCERQKLLNSSGANINPGSGSFTFNLDVTALGDLTFELANGSVVFDQSFTTNGGLITANDGTVQFNGAVTADAGTTWVSSSGGFEFNGTVTYAGDLVFDLTGGGSATFNSDFTATGGNITAEGGILEFTETVTSTANTTWEGIGGGFRFDGSFASVGDLTFDLSGGAGGDTGSATFASTVDFGEDGGAAATGTFNGGSLTFVDTVTVHDLYDFTFDGGVNAAFGGAVDFLGNHTFTFNGAPATADDEVDRAAFSGNVSFVDGAIITIAGTNYDNFNTEDEKIGNLVFNADSTIDFAGDFNLVMDGPQFIEFGGGMNFAENAKFTVSGADTSGELKVSGNSTMAGPFELLVTGGQTVNWSGKSDFAGDVVINTWNAGVGGNADVDFGSVAGFGAASGVDLINIGFLTDGSNDDVAINGRAFKTGNFALLIGSRDADGSEKNQSVVNLTGGTLSGASVTSVDLKLFADSTLEIQTVDPATAGLAQANQWAFSSISDGDSDSGTVNLAGGFDGTLFIRGGEYSGDFTQDNNGAFTLSWTQNESRFTGTADIKGDYQTLNQGSHRIGDVNGDRAKIGYKTDGTASDGIRSLGITQSTMYVENADILTAADGGLTLTSGLTAAAMLVIENDSVVDIKGDLEMTQAASKLMITGDSGSGVNLTIGGTSEINGMFEVSADSTGGTANADFQGDVTLGGMITQSNTSKVDFGSDLEMSSGAKWLLEDSSRASVAGTLDMQSDSALMLDDGTELAVTGNITSAGETTIQEGARLVADNLILSDGATMALIDDSLKDDKKVLLELGGSLNIESGATLYGSGQIVLGDEFLVEAGGTLITGVEGSAEGILEISGDNLKVKNGSVIKFGVNAEVGEAAAFSGGIGNSSIIKVDQNVVFESGANLEVDVQQGAYIPTAPSQGLKDSLQFVLLEAADFTNYSSNVNVQAGLPSVTRDWEFTREVSGGLNRLLAASTADYTNTLSGSKLVIGNLLNSFREPANADPNNIYGVLLGQLDTIQTASAYQAAILGFEPTSQITAIQTAALSQYHDVLRDEIRRRFTLVERRTPAPFRLGQPYQLAGQEAVVERSIRRQVRSNPTAESFGAFWTRDLKTPSQGDIVGFDGNEYGGLGGFGWRLSDNWTVGVDMGYSAFIGDLNGGYGDTRVGTLRGGGFVTWGKGDGLFFDAALSGGWNSFTFNRDVPGTNLGNSSNADGFQIDGTFGTGYRMALSEALALTPNGSFLYSYINTGDIDEQYSTSSPATSAALAISPGDLSSFIGRVGADLSWSALPGLVVDARLGWQGNFTDNGNYSVGLAGTSANIPVSIRNQTLNTAYYGVGMNWNVLEQIDLNVRWEGRSGDGVNSQMLTGGVTISF